MNGVLAAFGVSQDAERLYRLVLRTSGLHPNEHRVQLGWSPTRLREALNALIAGLARWRGARAAGLGALQGAAG